MGQLGGGAGRLPAAGDRRRAHAGHAQQSAGTRAHANLELRRGWAEDLPVGDASVDVLVSNGVLNLVPHETPVFREVLRVLQPGGRVQLADIVVAGELSETVRRDIDLWTG